MGEDERLELRALHCSRLISIQSVFHRSQLAHDAINRKAKQTIWLLRREACIFAQRFRVEGRVRQKRLTSPASDQWKRGHMDPADGYSSGFLRRDGRSDVRAVSKETGWFRPDETSGSDVGRLVCVCRIKRN